jgi:hypothetical protein
LEAIENVREAIAAWLWAEDQKAISNLPEAKTKYRIIVSL